MCNKKVNRRVFIGSVASIVGLVAGVMLGWYLKTRETELAEKTVTTYTMTTTETVTPATKTIEKTVTTCNPLEARFLFSGVNLVWWPNNYELSSSKAVIDHLVSLPVNYLMLLLELNQESKNSSELTGAYDIYRIQNLTEYAKEKGMKVAWLPFIIVRDGSWRGEIEPEKPVRWFKSYNGHLSSIAVEANRLEVDLLMLGSELESMNKPIYNEEWTQIVKTIRELYRGPLCYSVNWWPDEKSFKNILATQWFRLLDYIGVSAYFELTPKNDPTLEELINAWSNPNRGVNPNTNIISDLHTLYRTFYKGIIFTEVGYRSVNGTNKQPYNFRTIPDSDNRYDPEEQANCYEALFTVFNKIDWWKGCFIWAYTSSLTIAMEDKDYTPLNKPAEDVIRKWYKK